MRSLALHCGVLSVSSFHFSLPRLGRECTRTRRLQYIQYSIRVHSRAGNHEPAPCNILAIPQSPPRWTNDWLYSYLASFEGWGFWLGDAWNDPKVREDVRRRASYSVLVQPGFRVISLNNIYCYEFNFLTFPHLADPEGMLAWLVKELQGAEDRKELVHLISHIPPGHNCFPVLSFTVLIFSSVKSSHFR